jgi:hypothetical protein
MDLTELCTFLLGTDQLTVKEVVFQNDKIILLVESTTDKAVCPDFQTESWKIHSNYTRHPFDLG